MLKKLLDPNNPFSPAGESPHTHPNQNLGHPVSKTWHSRRGSRRAVAIRSDKRARVPSLPGSEVDCRLPYRRTASRKRTTIIIITIIVRFKNGEDGERVERGRRSREPKKNASVRRRLIWIFNCPLSPSLSYYAEWRRR